MRLDICLLSFALIGSAVQSQQIPASSVSGAYRAAAGIVMPSIPSNLCTSDNALCYNPSTNLPPSGGLTSAEVQAMIDAANLGGGGVPWTKYFLGQTKCFADDLGNTTCAKIENNGTVTLNRGYLISLGMPVYNNTLSTQTYYSDCNQSLQSYTNYVGPIGLSITNNIPTGFYASSSGIPDCSQPNR